jgi:membrane protease YdiL (CAAX protease family)
LTGDAPNGTECEIKPAAERSPSNPEPAKLSPPTEAKTEGIDIRDSRPRKLVLVLDWFQTAVLRVFHAWPVPEDPITLVLNKTTGWLLWLAVLEIVFLGPISEELLYRGLLMGRFRGHGYVALGMITSAAVFMISHGDPHQYIDLFGAGLLLAWLYHRTGSLWPPVALHMLNNGWFAMHAILHLKS